MLLLSPPNKTVSRQDERGRTEPRLVDGRQESGPNAQVFALQEPRFRVAAEGPQALLQLEGLPVSEMQTYR